MSDSETLDWSILRFDPASLPQGVDKRSFYEGRKNFGSYVATARPRNNNGREELLGYDSFGKVFSNLDEEIEAAATLFAKYYNADVRLMFIDAPFASHASGFEFELLEIPQLEVDENMMMKEDTGEGFSEATRNILRQITFRYPVWNITITDEDYSLITQKLIVFRGGNIYFLDRVLSDNIEDLYFSEDNPETIAFYAPLVLRGLEEFFSAKENTQRVLGGNTIASLPFELVSRVMTMFSMDDFQVYSRLDPRRFEEYRAQRDNAALQYIREVLNYHAPIRSVFSFLLGATSTYISLRRYELFSAPSSRLNFGTIDKFYVNENGYKKNYILRNAKDRDMAKKYKRSKYIVAIEYKSPIEYFDNAEEYLYVYITDDGIVYDPYNKVAYRKRSGVNVDSVKDDLARRYELEMQRIERGSRQST